MNFFKTKTGDILENKGSVRWGSKGHYAEGGKKLSGGVKGENFWISKVSRMLEKPTKI